MPLHKFLYIYDLSTQHQTHWEALLRNTIPAFPLWIHCPFWSHLQPSACHSPSHPPTIPGTNPAPASLKLYNTCLRINDVNFLKEFLFFHINFNLKLKVYTSNQYLGYCIHISIQAWMQHNIKIEKKLYLKYRNMQNLWMMIYIIFTSHQRGLGASNLLFPSPGDLPNPGIEPRSLALQVGS